MYMFSKLFDINHVRYWANALHKRDWSTPYKAKIEKQIYNNAKEMGLKPEFAEEWATLGPWNI